MLDIEIKRASAGGRGFSFEVVIIKEGGSYTISTFKPILYRYYAPQPIESRDFLLARTDKSTRNSHLSKTLRERCYGVPHPNAEQITATP